MTNVETAVLIIKSICNEDQNALKQFLPFDLVMPPGDESNTYRVSNANEVIEEFRTRFPRAMTGDVEIKSHHPAPLNLIIPVSIERRMQLGPHPSTEEVNRFLQNLPFMEVMITFPWPSEVSDSQRVQVKVVSYDQDA